MNCIAICGDSASGKTRLGFWLADILGDSVVLECDRYHLWERGDPNWLNFTHLNPEANSLDLLWKDIQDLQAGKVVWRKNYNHSVGKFTEPQKIKPAKNLIVIGLHALIHPELYDVKIFMNTDYDLKMYWKIVRDVEKRGYTVEEILEQIRDRQGDYEKFLWPLVEHADIVLNFYYDKGLHSNIFVDKNQVKFDDKNHYNNIFTCIKKVLQYEK